MPSLESTVQQLLSPTFYRGLNPALTVTEVGLPPARPDYPLPWNGTAGATESLRDEGFFVLESVMKDEECERLSRAVTELVDAGLPPIFALVYDEFWEVLRRLRTVVSSVVCRDMEVTDDIWVWRVASGRAGSGWRPHRDAQAPASLGADHLPRVVNIWLPLTEARPSNGCIYCIPASRDRWPAPASTPFVLDDFHEVLALPAPAGSVLGWTEHLLHWGGRAQAGSSPRISMAAFFLAGEVTVSRSLRVNWGSLSFPWRLACIAKNITLYAHFEPIPDVVLPFLDTIRSEPRGVNTSDGGP